MVKRIHALLLAAIVTVTISSAVTAAAVNPSAPGAGLRAGAARIDITPAATDLPAPFNTIHDPIYVRALVLDDGESRAAIIVGDLPTIAPAEFTDLTRRIAEQIRAPVQNVLLAVTHDHNAVRIDHVAVGISLPGSARISDVTMAATLEAVRQAAARLQPARAGYATGTTPMVGPVRPPSQPGMAPAAESDSPVDRSIGVFKVEALSGQPIAFLFNSTLEPVINIGSAGEISADVAGATERYIEQRYADTAVAMYTVGSAVGSAYSARRSSAGRQADAHVLMNAMGVILGEDVLAAAARVEPASALRIGGMTRILQCPGKTTTPLNLPNRCSDAPGSKLPACVFKDSDSDPAALQIGVLRLGDLAIVTADANITQPVWQKLKSAAPKNTALVSLVYGPVHYVVEDAAYPSNSYQVTASMAKAGCAAGGFVNGALEMLRQTP